MNVAGSARQPGTLRRSLQVQMFECGLARTTTKTADPFWRLALSTLPALSLRLLPDLVSTRLLSVAQQQGRGTP